MSVVEAGAAPYADDARLSGSDAGRRRRAQFALFILRAAVPFFPVAAVLTASDASVATPAVLILAAGWFVALRRMFSSAWLSPLALGIPIIAALGALSGLALMSGFADWLPGDDVTPLELSLMAVAVYVASAAAESIARRTGLVYPRVLIVGAGNGGMQLAEELYGNPDLPFRCLGLLVEDGEDWTSETVRVLGTTDDVEDLLALWEPDIAVLASGENGKTVSAVLDGEENGIRLLSLPHFYEHVFGRVPIHTLSPTWFMSLVHLSQAPVPADHKKSLRPCRCLRRPGSRESILPTWSDPGSVVRAGTCLLPPVAIRGTRTAVPDAQVQDDGPRGGAGRPGDLGRRRRPPRDSCRPHHAENPPGRAASAVERPDRGDEHRVALGRSGRSSTSSLPRKSPTGPVGTSSSPGSPAGPRSAVATPRTSEGRPRSWPTTSITSNTRASCSISPSRPRRRRHSYRASARGRSGWKTWPPTRKDSFRRARAKSRTLLAATGSSIDGVVPKAPGASAVRPAWREAKETCDRTAA